MSFTPEDREQIIKDLGASLFGSKARFITSQAELAQGVRQAWDAFDKAQGEPTAADLALCSILRLTGSSPEQIENYAESAVRLRRR